jgi:uncharacterized UPF0160 family protein
MGQTVYMILPRSFGTHDGSFHADEVSACSLLLLFHCIDKDKIYRTRNPDQLATCEYVCDVGGIYDPSKKRFDHHQLDYQGTMSSAGMILLFLKNQGIISEALYDYYNRGLFAGIDAHDNGVAKLESGTTSFSQVVSNFLPIEYDSSQEEMETSFFQAVDFVVGHLNRLRQRFSYTQTCEGLVKKAMMETSSALIFDRSLPWMENFFELGGDLHPAQFVIMPSGKHWKLRGIPPSLNDRMKVRKPLPENWAGLQDKELQKVTGISGAIFCHKGRFISIWKTKEDALKALHIAMKKGF